MKPVNETVRDEKSAEPSTPTATPVVKWELRKAINNAESIGQSLAEGWEPFQVEPEIVWFKRPRQGRLS